jgi:Tfp pilus assembly protein PilF
MSSHCDRFLAPIGRRCRLAAIALFLATAGCAAWRSQMSEPGAGISQQRKERHEAALQACEQQRDQALLEAALGRWQQGDVAGCEVRLRSLVSRRPDYCDAHLQLAELAWSCENAAEAETEYRTALKLGPTRADVEHALGMLLAESGRIQEARRHLARACELAPESELYRTAAATVAPIAPAALMRPVGKIAAQ